MLENNSQTDLVSTYTKLEPPLPDRQRLPSPLSHRDRQFTSDQLMVPKF